MIIAVDGTLASGKGTLAKRLAKHFGLAHLDTGLLYRAIGYLADKNDVDVADDSTLSNLACRLDLDAIDEAILRTDSVAELASKVAQNSALRTALLQYQRRFAAQDGGAVLDGRDIGTVICPTADYKFWVDATAETRAQRRLDELHARGILAANYSDVLEKLIARDTRDKSRKNAPMVKASDAILLDTTHLDANASFRAALDAMGKLN